MTTEREKLIATLEAQIGVYWNLAYAEGVECRTKDNKSGDAGKCWHAIQQSIAALSQPAGVPDGPTDEQLARGRQAIMALQCSSPRWPVRKHYEAAGYDTAGIPDFLLDMKFPMPKENRAQLLWYAMQGPAAPPPPAAQQDGETGPEAVCAQAYQVVGSLLSDVGQFDTELGDKILDNLAEAKLIHDVLPWPSFAAQQGSAEAVAWRSPVSHPDGSETWTVTTSRTGTLNEEPLYTHPAPTDPAVLRDAEYFRHLMEHHLDKWHDSHTRVPVSCSFNFEAPGHNMRAGIQAAIAAQAKGGES